MIAKIATILFLLGAGAAAAQTHPAPAANLPQTRSNAPPGALLDQARVLARRGEEIRSNCIQNRRYICGRILKIFPDGLVVDSGYASLLQAPLNRSWLVPGTVVAARDPHLVESKEPDAVCVGLVFVTDIPKTRRAKPKEFDYLVAHGYPAGQRTYTSIGSIQRTVRQYSLGLESAVRLNLKNEANQTHAYLLMPERAGGRLPPLLSQTGAFADVRALTPSASLLAYDIIVPFWSDGAGKSRWIALPKDESGPNGKIAFSPAGEWKFPKGTVFVKHFELATDPARPEVRRRLETRLLVCDATGGVYGVTYKWRPDNSDADLLATNLSEPILIHTATGTRTQTWYYPSRQDCLVCHTANAGLVLGVKTRQLNRPFNAGSESSGNQLRQWNRLGLFAPPLSETALQALPKLAASDDPSRSLEDRARSYLDANCAHCHRPGGTVAYFDARYDTPLAQQNLIGGQVLIDQGIDGPRAIAPHDIWRSIIYMRANSIEAIKMPPLAHNAIDENGMKLLRQWIEGLPGRAVLEPPTISPAPGNYAQPVDVALKESQPGAAIRYTLDGSVPTTSDPLYEKPLHLAGPTILRAKAFKPGFTKSITVQGVYIIGE